MYQICMPASGAPEFCACGSGGISLPQSGQEALLICLRQGTAQVSYRSLVQTAYAGDMAAAVQECGVTFSENAVYDWLLFRQEGLRLAPVSSTNSPEGEELALGSLFSCVRPARLQLLFGYLLEAQKEEPFKRQMCAYLAGLILCEASRQFFYPGTSKHHLRFLDILNWLQNHYTEPFSLNEISGRFLYNKVYLCRLFKDKTGESMYAFVTRLRMEKAMALLLETTETVKEIARQVGYTDEKQFIRNFRQHSKMTATQYRLQSAGKAGGDGIHGGEEKF